MWRLRPLFFLFIIQLPLASSDMEAIEALLRRLDGKRAPASVQEAAAKAFLGRFLPTHVSSFEFKIVSKDACGGYSCFWINNFNVSSRKGAEIAIKGTTAVEIVSGSLPSVKDEGVMIQRPVPWNYYQNAVTSS
ncbi:alpha-N-acetylglucosaminidase-like isoform X3 [Macadamia integrifolia]|uniref:alpha-N-acetylglucosaminidase-like isoform X3 n=1 Tax=Macadamia integrifolia TaxID=60698 RepID=UPI001C4EA213|nr:alpha-N-acetylglucosaminidase-like isoform X3 [Macadamia integrifolia]